MAMAAVTNTCLIPVQRVFERVLNYTDTDTDTNRYYKRKLRRTDAHCILAAVCGCAGERVSE